MQQFLPIINVAFKLATNQSKGIQSGFNKGTQCLLLVISWGVMLPCVTWAQNPQMVKDINSGGASFPEKLTVYDGNLYFRADDGSNGVELWKSDGTKSGTNMVKNINSSGKSSPDELIVYNENLYFEARDGSNGNELWKSDGTKNGTNMVKDIYSGGGHSTPHYLTVYDGNLYFWARDGSNGDELWKSDGTKSGNNMVKDINNGIRGSDLDHLTVYNSNLYFEARDGSNGNELWKSDGTAGGTNMVKDVNSGSGGSYPDELTVYNGNLYFQADDVTNGDELWKSDGTNTNMVKDINSSGSSLPGHLTVYNGSLYFSADDGTNGDELWKSDGTNTNMVKDINSSGNSSPAGLTIYNGSLYFVADDGTNGRELWKTDGTNTNMVKDINSSGSSSPEHLTVYNGSLYFEADDGTNGSELWKSDGTAGGTKRVTDINSSGGSYPDELTVYDGNLYFRAGDGTNGSELWKYAPEWTGSSGASWSNASNWEGEEPEDTVSAYIPKGLTNYPDITANQKVHNLTLQSGGTNGQIDVQSSNTLTVKGDITNNGKSNLGDGTIKMNNTNDSQAIKGSSKTMIDNLTIDNGNDINLESNVEIQSTLTLTNGVVDIPNSNDSIIINDGSSVSPSGGSSSSYIQGKITKVGDDAFTFPLGDGNTWARLKISAPANTTDEFTASYDNSNYSNTTSFASSSGLNNVSDAEFWTLDRVNGNSNVDVKLFWEDGSASGSNIDNLSALRIVHWDAGNSEWENLGNNSTSGSASSGTIKVTNVSNFSPFTFGSESGSSNPLPVELMKFTASKKPDKVILRWMTASETQNSHFLVQKRSDNTWQTIGKVSGQGTTTKPHPYQLTDRKPVQGYQYYRLKQVDHDGSHSYSNIRQVHYQQARNSQVRVLTNPVEDKLAVNIQSQTENRTYEVTLTTIYGREVYQDTWQLNQGDHERQIAVSRLKSGQYVLLINSRDKVYKRKIVKQ